MRKLWLLPLLLLFVAGCQRGVYRVEPQIYEEKVRTLGVVPVLVDSDSAIGHADSVEIAALLDRTGRGVAPLLVEKLRSRKRYFDVRGIEADPVPLAGRLARPASQNDKVGEFRYRVDPEAARQLCADHVVDGLLVVVLHGAQRLEKRFERNGIRYLEAVFQRIEARAMVVLADGRVVWEFPASGGYNFLDLEYPDFDEAYYNRTDQVRIHQVTLGGLERRLAPGSGKGANALAEPYADLLTQLTLELRGDFFRFW